MSDQEELHEAIEDELLEEVALGRLSVDEGMRLADRALGLDQDDDWDMVRYWYE